MPGHGSLAWKLGCHGITATVGHRGALATETSFCCRGWAAAVARPHHSSHRNPRSMRRLKCRSRRDHGTQAAEIPLACRGW
ncbi:hypothetical protein Q3G72_016722 [Acer saccharum]|nr:hypothetical protein Q3G72_016722 [Acer saccharum]